MRPLQGETGIIVTDRAAVKDRGLLGAIDIGGNLDTDIASRNCMPTFLELLTNDGVIGAGKAAGFDLDY